MKANAPRRKIFDDAIDVLTGPEPDVDSGQGTGSKVQEIPIEKIVAFGDHPFRLYEGERLDDMVESIKTHGVLTPVIVRKIDDKYEMLAGHNRTNAAKIAGLATVPAIVKEDISDEEAYVYVIETNLMQRSFSDFLPSEKASILEKRYNTIKVQGKRNDIIREIALLEGKNPEQAILDSMVGLIDLRGKTKTAGFISKGQKDEFGLIDQEGNSGGLIDQNAGFSSREVVAAEYGLSSKTVARLLRLNNLIPVFKEMVDKDILPLYAAVELSFLSEAAQGWINDAAERYKFRINMKSAKLFRDVGEDLTSARVDELAKSLSSGGKPQSRAYQNVRLPKIVYKKYFKGMNDDKVQAIIQVALDKYFKEQG